MHLIPVSQTHVAGTEGLMALAVSNLHPLGQGPQSSGVPAGQDSASSIILLLLLSPPLQPDQEDHLVLSALADNVIIVISSSATDIVEPLMVIDLLSYFSRMQTELIIAIF